MALSDHPRHPLLFGPSPVHRLERLTPHLGGAQIWAKREDCNSGIAFGGNKVRKLEYLAADALAQGCDTLVSIGGVQSNHTRAVAGVAARLGLACVLIQESWVDWPDAVYDRVGNILLSRLMGADVRLVTADFGIGVKESWERALSDVETAGGKPYAIPAGASDHPLGGLGFANWAREVEQQERSLGVFFDTVVVCSVTGSTQAGMVAGFAAADRRRRVIGIDASAKPAETRSQVLRIAQRTGKLLGLDRDLTADHVELDERYHTGTYGIPDRHEPMPNRWAAYLPSSRSATSDARIPRRHRGVAEVAIRAAGVAAGRDGHTLIDRRVYLPVSWAEDRDRCRAAGVPDTVGFATRSELAMNMITAAVRAGCQPAGWPRTRCTATAVSSAPGCASRAGPAPRGAPTDQARADPPNGPSPRAGPCRTDQ